MDSASYQVEIERLTAKGPYKVWVFVNGEAYWYQTFHSLDEAKKMAVGYMMDAHRHVSPDPRHA